jgi:transposase-like protein
MKCIAVDETKMKTKMKTKTKMAGKQLISSYGLQEMRCSVDSKEVLAFRCSFARSSLDAELFLKDILLYCENKPLFLFLVSG